MSWNERKELDEINIWYYFGLQIPVLYKQCNKNREGTVGNWTSAYTLLRVPICIELGLLVTYSSKILILLTATYTI